METQRSDVFLSFVTAVFFCCFFLEHELPLKCKQSWSSGAITTWQSCSHGLHKKKPEGLAAV